MSAVKNALMKRLHARLAGPPYCDSNRLVVSVSGGVDSMVLLDLLRRMAHIHQAKLEAFHVNHHTGTFAEEAKALVENYCAHNEIPLTVRDYIHGSGNFEHGAAAFRREALNVLIGDDGLAVLGHHETDQAETLLLALSRGAGMGSPIAMEALRGRRARPFLDQSKTAILEYAEQFSVPYLEDPSNQDTHFFRNRIRHEVLPRLNDHHGHSESRIAAFATEYETVRSGMALHGQELMKSHFKEDTQSLNRSLFKETPDYLWPFIFDAFWKVSELPKPKRQEFRQICNWITSGEQGCLNLKQDFQLWIDHDALVLCKTLPKLQVASEMENIQWGPWTFKIKGCPKICLTQAKSLSKVEREFFRQKQVPQRYRRTVPLLEWEGEKVTLSRLLMGGKDHKVQVFLNQGDRIYEYLLKTSSPGDDHSSRKAGIS